MMEKKGLWIFGVLAIVFLIGSITWLLAGPNDHGQNEPRGKSAGKNSDLPFEPRRAETPVFSADNPLDELEQYVKWAKYPPHSRPLHAGQSDLTNPYDASQTPIRVIAQPARGCRRDGEGGVLCDQKAVFANYECKLTPEKSISVGRREQKVFLFCRSNVNGVKIALRDFKSKVYIKDGRELKPSLPPVSINDQGIKGDAQAGDFIYTFVVRPTGRDWGPMYLEVEFQAGDHRHVQRAGWYHTPHIVAQFGSGIHDQAKNGHLMVSVPVRVRKAGYYIFDANLQRRDGDKQFIASAIWEGELKAGSRTIQFEFFGKILFDRHFDGPYIVRDIRGMRDNGPVNPAEMARSLRDNRPIPEKTHTEPMREYMEPYDGTHATRKYRAAEFSRREWQSPEKDQRIKLLKSRAGS